MRSFWGTFLTVFAILFSIPTVLILVTWNTLPNEPLYSVKTGLENIAFTLTKATPIATALSVKYTDRRFDEATVLLDRQNSSEGLVLLVTQAQQAGSRVVEKRDTKQAAQLVENLTKYKVELSQKKETLKIAQTRAPTGQQTVLQSPAPFSTPSHVETGAPAIIKTPKPATPTPITEPVTQEIIGENIEDIEETEEELEEIIQEIETQLPQAAQEHMPESIQEKIEKKGNGKKKEKGDKNDSD